MPGRDRRGARGTRGRILGLLRRSEQTVSELAATVGISDNAVRTHLLGMERDGLVRAAERTRLTGGKPAHVYELTEAGLELFPRGYAVFLSVLLGVLRERQDSAGARRLLREAGRRVAAEHGEVTGDVRTRVEHAAVALRELGGDVEVEVTPGGYRIRGHGCPLSSVVAAQPLACVMAESFVSALLGRPVTERCQKGDRPRCAFDVKT